MTTNLLPPDPANPAPPVPAAATSSVIRDERVSPAGVLPRRLQTWLMAGTALVVLLIVFVTGRRHESAPQPTARPEDAGLASADRIRAFARQLLQGQGQNQPGGARGDMSSGSSGGGGATSGAVRGAAATAADEARKREAQSLFADNVVFSRRPAAEQPSPASGAAAGTAGPARPVDPPSPGSSALNAQLALLDRALGQLPPATTPARPGATPVIAGANESPTASPSETPAVAVTASAAPLAERRATEGQALPLDTRRPAVAAAEHRTEDHPADGPRLRLLEGTVIEAVLLTRLNGTFAGPVACLVTTPVYSEDRQHVLIPAGARVLGSAAPVQAWGDSRLAVSFHRLLMPDGHTYSLDVFKGLDAVGETGLTDSVNRHYLEVFGASAAIGALSGLAQYGTTSGLTSTSFSDEYRQAAGASLAQSTSRVLDRYLNVLPTITIREGYRVKVYLTADVELPVYDSTFPGGVQ